MRAARAVRERSARRVRIARRAARAQRAVREHSECREAAREMYPLAFKSGRCGWKLAARAQRGSRALTRRGELMGSITRRGLRSEPKASGARR